MRFRGLGSSRPSDYLHAFKVLKRSNMTTSSGKVVKEKEKEQEIKVPDGILATATEKEKERWSQNQHPITHTIVSYHPPVGAREKDILIDDVTGKRFQIQGIEDPGGTNQFAIYYVLERKDVR